MYLQLFSLHIYDTKQHQLQKMSSDIPIRTLLNKHEHVSGGLLRCYKISGVLGFWLAVCRLPIADLRLINDFFLSSTFCIQ
jgi:hypothetical protein